MRQERNGATAVGDGWALAHKCFASAGTGPPLIQLDSRLRGGVAVEFKNVLTKRYRPNGIPDLYTRTGEIVEIFKGVSKGVVGEPADAEVWPCGGVGFHGKCRY